MSTTTLPLYALAELRDSLDEQLAESEGVLTPEMEATLDALAGDITTKVENVALYIREQLATADAIEIEVKRLGARMAAKRKAADGLKAYLKFNMERLELTKVKGVLASVSIQRNSVPSVTTALTDDDLRAAFVSVGNPVGQFVRETVRYTVDREAVLAAQKASYPIPAEIVIDLGSHIRIR